MKKNFLQDVVPANQKRSIRDIPLPSHKKQVVNSQKNPNIEREKIIEEIQLPTPPQSEPQRLSNKKVKSVLNSEQEVESYSQETVDSSYEPESLETDEKPYKPKYKKSNNSFMKKIILPIAIGAFIFLIFFISRTEATITIQSKKENSEVNNVVLLDGSNQLATKTQISKTVSKTLMATSEEQVEKQASGRIKITNSHKETPQELVKNTRFQTPSGLIYRIKDSIVVPGYTMNGSTIVPGTLEVQVYADSPGEEYNISNVKFTIPGFEGREQYTKITAESIGDMSGGYIGIRKVVSKEAKEQAEEELKEQLKGEFEQTPSQSTEYIIVPDTNTLSYGELQDKAEGDNVILSLSAQVDAYSFSKKNLFNYIGQNTVKGATLNDQFTVDTQNLKFSVEDGAIKISGPTTITWLTDTEQLKKSFLGKKKSEVNGIIDSYMSFKMAKAKLSPFWKTRFPENAEKIEVIIEE